MPSKPDKQGKKDQTALFGIKPNFISPYNKQIVTIMEAFNNPYTCVPALRAILTLIESCPRKIKKDFKKQREEILNLLFVKPFQETGLHEFEVAERIQTNISTLGITKYKWAHDIYDQLTNALDKNKLLFIEGAQIATGGSYETGY